MKNFSKITLDSKNRKLIFHGDCNEVRDLCEAMCCRIYDVTVSEEERRSGQYQVRQVCSVTNAGCDNKGSSCMNRRYFLKKKEDSSCVYLDEDNKCSIHPRRPQACRDFDCSCGWQISFAYAPDSEEYYNWRQDITKMFMRETLKDDMRFFMNPLIKLKTLFYSKKKGEIMFVKEMPDKCSPVPVKCELNDMPASDKELLYLVSLFDGGNTLKDVRDKFADKTGNKLSKEDLYKLVWLLYCQKLVQFNNHSNMFRKNE
jgi:Fe-S-cluster containining protein